MKKRLLTLAWLLCPLLFMAQAMADFTVYVKVNTTQKVNLYFWGVDGATTPSWPGNAMTKTTKHNYTTGADDELYTYTISGTSAASINGIFNLGQGSPQTTNLTLVKEGIYEWNGNDRASATIITGDYTNSASTYKVYFEDPGWDEVYAYPFSNDAAVDEAWPGKKITKNAAGKYEYSYTATSAPNNIIFNNGSNRQTPDLTFVDGDTYTHVYTVVGSSTALFGGTNVWTADLEGNDMTANSDGTYTWTKEGVELSEDVDFKVTYGHKGWNLNYGANCIVDGDNVTIPITETATYDVTITLDLANSSLKGVATKQGGTEQNATITSVQYAGDDNSWTGADFTADATAANKYTYELDLSSNTENIGFKFLPNDNWLGYGNVTLDAPTGWITDSGEPNHNFVLNNASTGYQKYLITATWEENPSATEGWTLKVEGTEERPTPTYTAKFTNDGKWTTVYAYLYNDAGTVGTEWPGTAIEKNGDTWDFSAQLTSAPTHIIFNAGDKRPQTEDLVFTEGQTYSYTVPKYTICGYDKFYGGWGATEGKDVNVMTLGDDGKFTWTKTDVEVKSSELEQQFRLQVDNAYTSEGIYNVAGFNGNISNTLPKAGTYDVTVTFDQNTMTVSAEYTRHTVPAKDYTVTLVNSAAWSTVNAYAWSGDGDTAIKKSGDWPGSTATKSDAKVGTFDTYTYTFENMEEDDVPEKIIWNDGTDQTADLTFEDGATYWNETVYGLEGAAFGGWKDGSQYRGIENILTKTGEGIYTYTVSGVNLTGGTAYPYRVSVNGAWTSLGIGGVDGNKEFRPEEDGEYTITITLNTNPDVKSVEATLTKDERPATSTYNATFVNTPGWENVYAYVFANDAPIDNVEWPGVKLNASDGDADTYSYSAELTTSPQYIVFNNGVTGEGADQTDDLTWENGKQYTVAVEYINLLGDMNNWDTTAEALFTKSPDAENAWVIEDINLSSTTEDQEFKLFVNDNWLGFNDITINAPEGWLVDDGTDDHDIKFMNSITGFKTYSLTATWTPNGKINKGWTLTMTGKEQRETEINAPTSVQIPGGWNEWNAENLTYTINESGDYVYTTEVDLTTYTVDPSFKLKINNGGDETDNWGGWLGWAAIESGALIVDRPDGWVYEKEGDGNRDLMLANSISGYQKYQFTATWVPSNNPYTGWTLKIEGTEERQAVADTYTYYVDMQNWTPSAHIWNNDGALTPDWTQGVADHTLNAFGNEYSVSKYEFAGEPTNIMFKGADDSQKTSDMPFVNGATYGNDGDNANGVFIFSDDENQFKPEQNVNVNGNAKYVRQFTVGEPCTVVLPFALGADKVGDNAEAGQVGVFYRITAIAEGQINGNTEVPGAYTPYVFIPAVEYPFTYVGFGQLPAVPETKNYALNGGDVVFEWVTTATTVTSDNEWTYYGWDKSTHKFVKAAVGQANPFRSYIKIKTDKLGSMGLSAKESIDLSFINGGEATAISALRAAIADGEATVFDLQGRKVDNPTMRGVYIVNGKKYVVK